MKRINIKLKNNFNKIKFLFFLILKIIKKLK